MSNGKYNLALTWPIQPLPLRNTEWICFPSDAERGIASDSDSPTLAVQLPEAWGASELDRDAFSPQIEHELPFLRKAVRRWHRDKANGDDLVQATVLRALANAHLWQPGSSLRAWLLTIMRNEFLATAAKSKRSTELFATMFQQDLRVPEAGGARLVLRDVERGLRRLPAIQRTVLVAVGIDGKSYTEVADALGLSVGAVRCHLARARQRLRAAVEGRQYRLPVALRPARLSPPPARLPVKFSFFPGAPAPIREAAVVGAD